MLRLLHQFRECLFVVSIIYVLYWPEARCKLAAKREWLRVDKVDNWNGSVGSRRKEWTQGRELARLALASTNEGGKANSFFSLTLFILS